jgi:lipopolysaccharide transport system ATP-binding protein
MSDTTIAVTGLGKRYRIGRPPARVHGWGRRLVAPLERHWQRLRTLGGGGDEADSIWALRDISFQVHAGEVVGIIGRNGAGKSTLLKILSRITDPTEGRAMFRGRLASLLEVGTGFHPELTGRENIYLGGAVQGMRRHEIRAHFDDIVEFSGIEKFIDTPVKRYSSGMYVRLAFAVAAHLQADILLIDEVLAVGDVAFQKKCLGKMQEVATDGRTVLFVSHNMAAVRQLCNRALLLSSGRLLADGPVETVVTQYLQGLGGSGGQEQVFNDDPAKAVAITAARVACAGKGPETAWTIDDPIALEIETHVHQDVASSNLGILVSREGVPVFSSFDIDLDPDRFAERPRGRYRSRIELPRRLLKAGLYTVTIGVGKPASGPIDLKVDALSFELNDCEAEAANRAHARSRPGQIIVPLAWETARL